METISSQSEAVVETGQQSEQLETRGSPEQTAADTRNELSETVREPSATLNGLLNNLENCIQKSHKGELDVSDLEQLTADFATFLTHTSPEKDGVTAEQLDDFYAQLKKMVSEAVSDERVSGNPERKTALNKFTEGLKFKLSFFKNSLIAKDAPFSSDSHQNYGVVGG